MVSVKYQVKYLQYVDHKHLASTHRTLCKKIAAANDRPADFFQIYRSALTGSWLATLNFKMKTHKPANEVECRCLHAASSFAWEGLSRWVDAQLRPFAKSSLIIHSSLELKAKIQNVVTAQGDKLATFDIKEFFTKGKPKDLVEDCMSFYNGPLRTLVSEALTFLLESQYIQLASSAHTVIHCTSGSGMGLPHSGTVCMLSFRRRVEIPLLENSLGSNPCKFYYRYFDDILVLFSNVASMRKFFVTMGEHAHHYKLKCTDVSRDSVKFLDTFVSIINGRISVQPSIDKPLIPLAISSAHAPSVHKAWPRAVSRRIQNLAGSNAEDALQKLSSWYRLHNASPYTCTRVLQVGNTPNLKLSSDKRSAWLKLGFHPILYSAIPRAIRACPVPDQSSDAGLTVRITWRNRLPSVGQRVMASNKGKLKNNYGGSSLGKVGGCFVLFRNKTNNNI